MYIVSLSSNCSYAEPCAFNYNGTLFVFIFIFIDVLSIEKKFQSVICDTPLGQSMKRPMFHKSFFTCITLFSESSIASWPKRYYISHLCNKVTQFKCS